MSIIMGLDPGSWVTGFGVIRVQGKRLQYIASGCIRTRKGGQQAHRLQEIFVGVDELLQQHQPEQFAIEQVFLAKNANSALKLGQARGVAMVAAAIYGVDIAEYAARQIKQAVVGNGGAEKQQVQHMVCQLLGLSAAPQEDAADALAVAICHAHNKGSSLHGRQRLPHRRRSGLRSLSVPEK